MKEVIEIAKILEKIGKKVYIVGGFTRDMLFSGYQNSDIDLSTNATPDEIETHLNCLTSIGKKYGTSIIKQGNKTFEITTFREDIGSINNRKPAKVIFTKSLEKDAYRRDLSCNAIYYDPLNKLHTDPTGGTEDIENNIIRFIGKIEDRINEDALRILRFIRFKNKYNFTPADNNYFDIMKKNISLLNNISGERMKQELDKIFISENNIQALQDLKQIGFFKEFIPELNNQEATQGSKYHQEGNVWIHTKMTLEVLNTLRTKKELSNNHFLDLFWTMLLHDISKPECFSTDDDGNNHYYKHEEYGAKLFKDIISKQFYFSNKSSHKIHWLIENHLKVFKIGEMRPLKARKLMMHEFFSDLLIVGKCDHMGRIPASTGVLEKLHSFYNNFITLLNTKNFLTGTDIIKKYPHLSGPAIGEKLREENDKILLKD